MSSLFGTFVDKKSFIHNLNPSLKLIGVVLIIVLIFLPLGFFGLSICFVILSIL
jgi:energy-coupling factor transporter transmembrane protein EcfT